MRKLLIISCLMFANFSGAAEVVQPSKEKVEYFLEISGLDGLSEKISEYLYLLELKRNKKLLKSKSQVKKLYEKYYPKEEVRNLLVENYAKNFNEQEINKLIAIFETSVMKKMLASQGTSIKEVLSVITSKENAELKAELSKLIK